MINKIKALQANGNYKVSPINLSGYRYPEFSTKSNLFASQDNNTFNLNHPKAQSDIRAKHLDLLA